MIRARSTTVTALVLAVTLSGSALAQGGTSPADTGAQSGAIQQRGTLRQEQARLQEQLRLLEQARVKEGGK